MKKIPTPKNWKDTPRGSISAGYADIAGADWQRFLDDFKANPNDRPIVLFQGEVLDGWQRLRGHIHHDIKPTFVEFEGTEAEAEAFVQRHNDNRRHESEPTRERRIRERRERVATMRQEGMSQRAIAEKERVSRKTVRDDLETSGGPPRPPGPENAKINGNDGKSYSSSRSSTRQETRFCERCQRVGPVKDCQACEITRRARKGEREPGDDTDSEKADRKRSRKVGKVLFEFKRIDRPLGELARAVEEFGKAFGKGESYRKLDKIGNDFATEWKKTKKTTTRS